MGPLSNPPSYVRHVGDDVVRDRLAKTASVRQNCSHRGDCPSWVDVVNGIRVIGSSSESYRPIVSLGIWQPIRELEINEKHDIAFFHNPDESFKLSDLEFCSDKFWRRKPQEVVDDSKSISQVFISDLNAYKAIKHLSSVLHCTLNDSYYNVCDRNFSCVADYPSTMFDKLWKFIEDSDRDFRLGDKDFKVPYVAKVFCLPYSDKFCVPFFKLERLNPLVGRMELSFEASKVKDKSISNDLMARYNLLCLINIIVLSEFLVEY